MTTSVKTAIRSAAIGVGIGLEMLSGVIHFHFALAKNTRDWWAYHQLSKATSDFWLNIRDAATQSYQSIPESRVYAEDSVDRNIGRITALVSKLRADFLSMQG